MNKEAILRRLATQEAELSNLQDLVLALMTRMNALEARIRQQDESAG